MDAIKELEKYKSLLDEGALTEEEFRQIKQKLLGLTTDAEKYAQSQGQQQKDLEEMGAVQAVEQWRQEQEEAERWKQEQVRQQEEVASRQQHMFDEEKIRERAQLEAAKEMEIAKKMEHAERIKQTARTTTSVVRKIFLWAITVCFAFLAWGSLLLLEEGAVYAIYCVLDLLVAIMACPLITAKIKEIPALGMYYRFKKWIVVVLVVLMVVLPSVAA